MTNRFRFNPASPAPRLPTRGGMHVWTMASLWAGGICAAGLAWSEPYACPEEFDQTYEWNDQGYFVNGLRASLLEDGIANDPGANAPYKGKQRVIISGDDQVVISESQGWLIELDEAAMRAGRKPYSRARQVWRRTYAAAIGNQRYRAEESSDKPALREVKPRRPGQDLDVRISGGPGPAEMNLTLAPPGAPEFARGPMQTIAGFRCITQIFAPALHAGPRVEACLLELPDSCRKRRLLKEMQLESSVVHDGQKKVVRLGRTTALRMGARGAVVRPGSIAPPPRSLGPPLGPVRPPVQQPPREPETPGLPRCNCREPHQNCTPAQQRACEARESI